MSITIAIPFFNAENYLVDAIKSVFAQTHSQWELLLINDGSTDNSLKIAENISDSRVRVISDGFNKGLASRLNEVASFAKYDVIARMDADDLMCPSRLEMQLSILNSNENIDLVTCGCVSITNESIFKGVRHHSSNTIDFSTLLNKKGFGILHAGIIVRKKWLERNSYNTELKTSQDYELWVRASANNDLNIHLLKEPLYYYRDEGNITPGKLFRAYKTERIVFRKYAKENKIPLLLKSYVKTAVVKVLALINKTDLLLLSRDNSPIANNNDKEVYEKKLSIILKTSMPTKP